MFSGYVDSWLCNILSEDIDLSTEYNNSVKQKLIEQLESLERIPFISGGRLFKSFFELD